MVLGWLTLSVECLFAGGVPGAQRAARRNAGCALSSPAPRTPYRNPWGMVAESSCVRCFPNVQPRTWHGPQWPRRCVSDSGGMVGLNVGSEAGAISPEISPAWAVYTAGGVSTSAIINSIPDVRSATFKGVRPSGGSNQVWREAAAHQRAGGRAKKNGACAGRPRLEGLGVEG